MMNKRKKRISKKVILSLMISAILAAEPAAMALAQGDTPTVTFAQEDPVGGENASEPGGAGDGGSAETEDRNSFSDELGGGSDQNSSDSDENEQQDPDENNSDKENGSVIGEDNTDDGENGGHESEETEDEKKIPEEPGDNEDGSDESESEENISEEKQPEEEEAAGDEAGSEEGETEEADAEDDEEVSDGETDADAAEGEPLEDEDNWEGTGHKAPRAEMKLTAAMVAEKQALVGTAERLGFLQENVNYSANKAVFMADSLSYAKEVAGGYGAVLDSYEDGVAVMAFEDDVTDIIAMAEDDKVKLPAVYPNFIYTLFGNEDYTYSGIELSDWTDSSASSGSQDPKFNDQYHHEEIHSQGAWAYNDTAGSGIKVAVIDSGVDKSHEDLNGRIASATSTAENQFNQGGDNHGHGTHVSGIIAANKDNGKGGAGIAYNASIQSIKALEMNPALNSGRGSATGYTADIIKAVNEAVKGGARVINMSLGGYGYDALYENTVKAAVDKGVVVVAAAGNEKNELSKNINSNHYCSPACFDGVITVSAKKKGEAALAYFSNYGAGIVDLTAPGTDITSSYPGSDYALMSGTSQATPMVAAAAAYILSVSPDLKNDKSGAAVENVKKILQDSATKDGFSDSAKFGAGLLNVEAAVKMAAPAKATEGGTGELTAPTVTVSDRELKANDTVQDTDKITLSATVGNAANSAIKIYYTLDGKTPTEQSTLYTEPFAIEASGNKTIKALAVYYGKKSKVTSLKVKVNAYVQSFTVLSKSNSAYLGAGKSLTLVADAKSFTPSYATKKKVAWEIIEGSEYASVNKSSGKLTAAAGIDKPVTVTVQAVSLDREDGGQAKASIVITLLPKVTALTLTAPVLTAKNKTCELNYDTAKTVQMSVAVEPAAAQTGISFSSSNAKVATVDAAGLITAVGNGTATITAKTTDGSNKKVSLKVKVTKAVQSLKVVSKTGEYQIAAGKSLQMQAEVTSDATNKKVNWEIVDGSNFATLSKSGKLTAKSSSVVTAASKVQVKATAADGSGKSDTATVTIYPVVTKKVGFEEGTSGTMGTIAQGSLHTSLQLHPYTDGNAGSSFFGRAKGSGETGLENFTYTSSNTKIATVTDKGLVQVVAGGKTGTVKIKAAAKDGSGKNATYTVKVIVPVTSLSIYSKSGVGFVGRGKALSLGALVNSNASNKKLTWTSSDKSIATVDKNGKVKGVSYGDSVEQVKITAAATDGSGVFKTVTVTVRPAIVKLAFPTIRGYATSVVDNSTFKKRTYTSGIYVPAYFDEVSPNSDRRSKLSNDYYLSSFSYTSSNTSVVQFITDENGKLYTFTPNAGTATVTYKALDGSGKTCKMKITVR